MKLHKNYYQETNKNSFLQFGFLTYWMDKKKILKFNIHFCFVLIILCISFIYTCQTPKPYYTYVFNTEYSLSEIWRMVYNLPLDLQRSPTYPPAIKKYFSYYELDFTGVDHYFGSFRSADYLISAHVFMPRFAIETVYLVHGYLMHSGYFNHLIKLLLKHNFAVAVLDLPGHGFSSGDMADIKSFSEYALALHDFIIFTKNTFLPPPYAVIGHSMGGATVIEYMLTYESVFQVHILTSPLVRSQHWNLSKFSLAFFGGFLKTVPAYVLDLSSDKEYLDFLTHDEPLRRTRVPLSWVKVLEHWNKKLTGLKNVNNNEILIIQGKKDTMVDWKYNIPFLTQMFPLSQIIYIENGKHELFQETKNIRNYVFNIVIEKLEEKKY